MTAVLGLAPVLVDEVLAQCSISVTPIAFGNYNVYQATADDATATVTVGCLVALNVQVRMNRGLYASSFSPRQMNRAGERLNYNLYFDSACTQIWGDGTGGTVVWNSGIVLLGQTRTVYGRITQLQDVSVGAYSDVVVVTAVF